MSSTTDDDNNNNNNNNNSRADGKNPATESSPAAAKVNKVTSIAKTKWLELQQLDYTDAGGRDRTWDCVTRTTKPAQATADAVVIIPLLTRYTGDDQDDNNDTDTLLVQQFRPPVGRNTLEFPAGLIDKGETPEQAALRELREETGYVGEACKTLPQVSRPACMSPGVTDETVHIVVVTVDLDNPYNFGTPKPELDEGEHIEIVRVSLQEGLQKVLDDADSGVMPIEGLYMFAVGLELGKAMK